MYVIEPLNKIHGIYMTCIPIQLYQIQRMPHQTHAQEYSNQLWFKVRCGQFMGGSCWVPRAAKCWSNWPVRPLRDIMNNYAVDGIRSPGGGVHILERGHLFGWVKSSTTTQTYPTTEQQLELRRTYYFYFCCWITRIPLFFIPPQEFFKFEITFFVR